MHAPRPPAFLFSIALACLVGLSACSAGTASESPQAPAQTMESSVTLPERRPDATVIIESVK
jgi:hypothetical protein